MEFAHKRTGAILSIIIFVIILYICGCAEIAPPPGGEVDKTKPQIIGSVPENGSVNVTPTDQIKIFFSERILKPVTGKSVYISPRPAEEPAIKWKSDHVIIKLTDSISSNQTYIVSFDDMIKDLRNNSLDTGSIIAFSTGPEIANGSVTGHVKDDNNKPQKSILVGLFDRDVLSDEKPIDSIYPNYISVTDINGYFSFQYLPQDSYFLLAFQDRNRNELFDPGKEFFALPDRGIKVDTLETIKDILLPINKTDTTAPDVSSVMFTSNGLLTVKLTKDLPLEYLYDHPEQISMKNISTGNLYKGQFFIESELFSSNVINGYIGELSEGLYSFQLFYDSTRPPLTIDSLQVKPVEDKAEPLIKYFTPNQFPQFLDDLNLTLQFSEPLDTSKLTENTFLLVDSDSTALPLDMFVENLSYFRFTSTEFKTGEKYKLVISEFDLSDRFGNLLGDSTRSYLINIIDPDSTGQVSGTVTVLPAEKQNIPVQLQFKHIRTRQDYVIDVVDNSFSITLPSGEYILSGFIDADRDRNRGFGSLFPLEFSETFHAHPDTISVRARFETSDNNIIIK